MQDRRDQELLKMLKPLEHRPYRMKRPALRFFCPLCRSERSISTRPRLSRWNYVQIVIASVFFFMVLFPFMEGNSFYLGFVIWIGAEAVVRLRFKKEIPCPHCGFAATWYKRDVNVAKKLVSQFWQQQESQNSEEVPATDNGNQKNATQNEVLNSAQYESESRLDSAGPL